MTFPRRIADLPYQERRLLVVEPDLPMQKVRKAMSRDQAAAATGIGAAGVGVAVVTAATGGLALPIIAATAVAAGAAMRQKAKSVTRAAGTLKSSGTDVLVVSNDEAAQLKFPLGHPRSKLAYAGHPANPSQYFPFADFHRALFELKVDEALRLVIALGATNVAVEHVQGWGRGAGINIGLALPTALPTDVSTSAGVQRSQSTYIMTRMTLNPSGPPSVPPGLFWLPQEALWQTVVRARMESGLSSFELNVESADDYGINGSVKALLLKTGIELGGNFREHQYTVWRLRGDFTRN